MLKMNYLTSLKFKIGCFWQGCLLLASKMYFSDQQVNVINEFSNLNINLVIN